MKYYKPKHLKDRVVYWEFSKLPSKSSYHLKQSHLLTHLNSNSKVISQNFVTTKEMDVLPWDYYESPYFDIVKLLKVDKNKSFSRTNFISNFTDVIKDLEFESYLILTLIDSHTKHHLFQSKEATEKYLKEWNNLIKKLKSTNEDDYSDITQEFDDTWENGIFDVISYTDEKRTHIHDKITSTLLFINTSGRLKIRYLIDWIPHILVTEQELFITSPRTYQSQTKWVIYYNKISKVLTLSIFFSPDVDEEVVSDDDLSSRSDFHFILSDSSYMENLKKKYELNKNPQYIEGNYISAKIELEEFNPFLESTSKETNLDETLLESRFRNLSAIFFSNNLKTITNINLPNSFLKFDKRFILVDKHKDKWKIETPQSFFIDYLVHWIKVMDEYGVTKIYLFSKDLKKSSLLETVDKITFRQEKVRIQIERLEQKVKSNKIQKQIEKLKQYEKTIYDKWKDVIVDSWFNHSLQGKSKSDFKIRISSLKPWDESWNFVKIEFKLDGKVYEFVVKDEVDHILKVLNAQKE